METLVPKDSAPNIEQSLCSYDEYRSRIDEMAAGLHGGYRAMPRTGVFDEEDYAEVINHPDTIFDTDGMPLVTSYIAAYPNANLDKHPGLQTAGYLMLPFGALTEAQLSLLDNSNYSTIVAEVTLPKMIDYSQPWEISSAQLDGVHGSIQSTLEAIGPTGNFKVKPLGEDGQPIVHHLMTVIGEERFDSTNYPFIVDSYTDKDQIINNLDSLREHHLDSFSVHSKSATVIHLDHADEIDEMLRSENWNATAHMGAEGGIDGMVLVTHNISEIPWIDPLSMDDKEYFIYVDSVSTNENARRKGIALELLKYGLFSHNQRAHELGIGAMAIP